jgi:hypothetical protein
MDRLAGLVVGARAATLRAIVGHGPARHHAEQERRHQQQRGKQDRMASTGHRMSLADFRGPTIRKATYRICGFPQSHHCRFMWTAFPVALVAVRLSRRRANARRTFGYARFEAIGALVNGLLLWGVTAYILWEAVGRIRQPPSVSSTGMLLVGSVGLAVTRLPCGFSKPVRART